MATTEQREERAIKELDEAKTALKEFREDENGGKLLETREELTTAQQQL